MTFEAIRSHNNSEAHPNSYEYGESANDGGFPYNNLKKHEELHAISALRLSLRRIGYV